jgi:hypothetical protein
VFADGQIRSVFPLFPPTLIRLFRLPEPGGFGVSEFLQAKPMACAADLKPLYSSAES